MFSFFSGWIWVVGIFGSIMYRILYRTNTIYKISTFTIIWKKKEKTEHNN